MKATLFPLLLSSTVALALGGCALGSSSSTYGNPSVLPIIRESRLHGPASSQGKIQHVVIIFQENRSFDNLFQGFPGADTASEGKNSKGQLIKLQPVSLATQYVIDHSFASFLAACDGAGKLPGTKCRNDGFDKEQAFGGPQNPQYVYVPHTDSQPYFDMGLQYALGDRMFQSHLDESFVSHQYIIAAQAHHAVNLPFGYWGCDGGPSDQVSTLTQLRTYGPNERACFNYTTMGDLLDKAGLTWHFYASSLTGDGGEWSGYQAVKHIRFGPDWSKDVISPNTRFFDDLKDGTLSTVTWITPICRDSDHVNCGGGFGPSWVASLVNAVGESQFWNTTAIFVMWDDWGGLYDHVPAPYEDYDGLGFRVPLLMISPYAKKHHVSHVQYETGSILRFIEDQFGLPQLAASDKRANDPALDCFDFNKPPRPFHHIKAPVSTDFFMHQINNGQPPDYE